MNKVYSMMIIQKEIARRDAIMAGLTMLLVVEIILTYLILISNIID